MGYVVRGLVDARAPVQVQSYAPEVVQADASIIAERIPSAPPKAAELPHQIPRAAKPIRHISATLAPSAGAGCAPLRVEATLIDTADGVRAVLSSPDALITDAKDRPFITPPRPTPWALGISYDLRGRPGLWAERDIGRLRIGVDASADTLRARVGFSF